MSVHEPYLLKITLNITICFQKFNASTSESVADNIEIFYEYLSKAINYSKRGQSLGNYGTVQANERAISFLSLTLHPAERSQHHEYLQNWNAWAWMR